MIFLGIVTKDKDRIQSFEEFCISLNLSLKQFDDNFVLAFSGERTTVQDNPELFCLYQGTPFGKEGDLLGTDELVDLLVEEIDVFANRISGNFRIVAFHRKQRILSLITDFFASYPLYYSNKDNIFIFGNKYAVIVRFLGGNNRLDIIGIAQFLHFGYFLNDRTHFCEVRRLASGSKLTYYLDPHNIALTKYVDMFDIDEIQGNEEELLENYNRIMSDSVRSRLSIDTESQLCLPLSGGLDSRMCLGLLLEYRDEIAITAFHFHHSKLGLDYLISNQLARKLGIKIVNLRYGFSDLSLESLLGLGWYTDYMGCLRRVHTHKMYHFISTNYSNPLVFSGVMGGELTGAHISSSLANLSGEEFCRQFFIRASISHLERDVIPNLLNRELFGDIAHLLYDDFRQCVNTIEADDGLTLQFRFDIVNWYGRWIVNIVKELAFNFVRVATPYIDERFVRFLSGIPKDYLVGQKLHKKAFRFMYDNNKTLLETVSTSGYLDTTSSFREKLFRLYSRWHNVNDLSNPYRVWLERNSSLIYEFFCNMKTKEFYDLDYLGKVLDAHGKVRDYTSLIFSILTIEALFRNEL